MFMAINIPLLSIKRFKVINEHEMLKVIAMFTLL
jgi:hypothetical protein